jgi:hypothetical protein
LGDLGLGGSPINKTSGAEAEDDETEDDRSHEFMNNSPKLGSGGSRCKCGVTKGTHA